MEINNQPELLVDDRERTLIDELLEKSRLYERGADYKALMDFVVRLPNFAPFNAMLLHIQKPGLRFAAFACDWKERFQRNIKEGARPLLILWPFGPVALVYDIEDTEGAALPDDIAQTFRAVGEMTKTRIHAFVSLLLRRGIELKFIAYGDAHAGHVDVVLRAEDKKSRPHYRLRINEQHDANVQFATLAHEMGHLFLGHLGPDAFLNIPDRSALGHAQRELEAESVSYIVCKRNGVASKAEQYLTNYVRDNTTFESIDMHAMLKAA